MSRTALSLDREGLDGDGVESGGRYGGRGGQSKASVHPSFLRRADRVVRAALAAPTVTPARARRRMRREEVAGGRRERQMKG